MGRERDDHQVRAGAVRGATARDDAGGVVELKSKPRLVCVKKLREAKFFLERLREVLQSNDPRFGHYLSAFLSAGKSVLEVAKWERPEITTLISAASICDNCLAYKTGLSVQRVKRVRTQLARPTRRDDRVPCV